MSDRIGGNDALPLQPSESGEGRSETAGWPPPGQSERMAALANNEAAADSFDPSQMEAELAALEAGAETPNERADRLNDFLSAHFPDIPADAVLLAIDRCAAFEDGCRELFEEPDLQLAEEDAQDPLLSEPLNQLALLSTTHTANEEAIATQTAVVAEREAAVATNETEIITVSNVERAALEAAHPDIQVPRAEEARAAVVANEIAETDALRDKAAVSLAQANAETEQATTELQQEAEINRDLNNVQDLQANFSQLKAEHGTIGALQMLLDPETGVQSPEMRSLVQRAVGTAQALVSAIPGKEAEIGRLLDQTGLNLAGASQAEVFAGLFTAAAASDDFTAEEVETLRAVVSGVDADIKTGTDVLNTATATTIDPETGETVPVHTEDNKAEIYPGVYTYTETGENAILELNIDGHYHKMDVTGMDGMTVGLLAEMMSWQAATEAMGATSFVESVYKLDFNFTGGGAYDPISLIGMRNKLTTMVGNFEGHDGDIFDPRTRQGLIQDQMRAASPTGTALGWENDHHGSTEHSRKLGLQNDVVLEEFSRYIQTARSLGGAIDPADIHAHLYDKFPDLVEPPDGAVGSAV